MDIWIYGYMEMQSMDEFTQGFTLNELIEKYQKEHITFTTIYLCKDEPDGTVIAVSWEDLDESHFKMFKQQSQSRILSFSNSISEQYEKWHYKICDWFDGTRAPLKLKGD